MNARTLSMLATGTLLGTLVIAQGQAAQDPPPAPQEAPAQDTTSDAPPAEDTATNDAPHTPLPLLDLRRITPLQGDAVAGKTKAAVCSACHGEQGVAIVPIFPNLAGQRAEYLYWQLIEYKRGNLPPSTMTPLVADLSDADMRDIARYYASLPANPPLAAAPATSEAEPADAATDEAPAPPDPALIAKGEALYLGGDPAQGIPPCQGCHGADALGFPDAMKPDRNGHVPYAVFPILRGQQHDYLQIRLAQYQSGAIDDSTADKVMNSVGHRLDSDSIAAISAYLSGLHQ